MYILTVRFLSELNFPIILFQHDLDEDSTDLPQVIRCSADRMSENGVYLLGEFMILLADHPWTCINFSCLQTFLLFIFRFLFKESYERTRVSMERTNPKFSHLPSPIPLRYKSLKSPAVFILIRALQDL